jgi:hypothetical protein
MISKYIVLPLVAIGLISGTYVALQPSDAAAANVTAQHASKMDGRRPKDDLTPEQHKALRQAVKECDYQVWKSIVGERPIIQKINEGNFATFCEAMKLMANGDKDAAHKLFKELGIKPPFHKHRPHRPGHQRPHAVQPPQQ